MKIVTARIQYELASVKVAEELLKDPRRVDPDYFTGIHEMGHVLDLMGVGDQFGTNTRARQRLNKALAELYIASGDPHDFDNWLRRQLPGGAFQGNPSLDTIGGMNVAEGLAHAFTEGELNPQANDVAKAMHKILVEESRPETSQLLRERMPNQMYRDSWESNYGPYPGHNPAAPPPERIPPNKNRSQGWEDLPYGFATAIDDMQEKYPQAVIGDLGIDELNRGGTAFVTPETRTGFEPGKPSVTKSRPDVQMERQWAEADLPSWDESFDRDTDEGFFPRWQSTTASEPWPEDQIDDFVDERADVKPVTPKAAAIIRDNPADLGWKTLLWTNNVMRGARTPEEKAYAEAVAAELAARSEQFRNKAAGLNFDTLEHSMVDAPGFDVEEAVGGGLPIPEGLRDFVQFWRDYPDYAAYKLWGRQPPRKTGMAFPPGYEVRRKLKPGTDPGVDLFEPGGKDIGGLNWYDDDDEVSMIDIDPEYRRRGLGTELFNHVKDSINPHLEHSDELTPDGAAFVKSFSAAVFADPDGTGVWQINAADQSVRFIPAPHRVTH